MTTTQANITPITAQTPQALQDLVQQAIASRTPIVDYGIAHRGLGNPPPANHYLLTQSAQGPGILDHYDRDMTVRVAAGATFGQIQQALKATNQCIPLDADDDLTIGEIITTNTYGPLRLTYGGPRDLLLGLHYIDGLGRNIQPGGRTVKNVAGLDITRLMVGSLGELGIIHQATFRTYAIPEQVLAVELSIDNPERLGSFLTDWIITDARPAGMTLDHDNGQWIIRLAYHGKATACNSQLGSLQSMIEKLGGLQVLGTSPQSYESYGQQMQARRSWQRSASALIKLVVQPASTGQVMKQIHTFASKLEGKLKSWASPAHGLIYLGGDLSSSQALELEGFIRQIISQLSAIRSWIARPAGSESQIAPFDPVPSEMPLFQRLKNTMDPHGLFNPGRCIVQEQHQQ